MKFKYNKTNYLKKRYYLKSKDFEDFIICISAINTAINTY